MPDPRSQLVSFPLNLGMDDVSFDENVQPLGQQPLLVKSQNTRLTKLPGAVSKSPGTAIVVDSSAGADCYGIVPCGAAVASMSCRTPGGGYNQVVLPAGVRRLSGIGGQTTNQSAYRPARVVSAASEAMPPVFMVPAIAYDTVNAWTFKAYVAADALGAVACLYVTVTDANGGVIVPPTEVVRFPGRVPGFAQWIGLSAHGANGVVLWYRDDATNVLRATRLSVGAGYVLSFAAGTAIFTPLVANVGAVGLAYDTTDTAYAYLITNDSAVAGSLAYHRVDVVTLAVTTVVAASGFAVGDYLGIAYVKNGASSYLAVGHSRLAGTSTVRRLDPTTLAATWAGTGPATYGAITIGFHQVAATVYAIAIVNDAGSTVSAANTASVLSTVHVWTTGASGATGQPVPWYRCAGQAVTHKVSDSEMYMLATLAPMYAVSATVTSVDFLEDPSIEVFTPHFATYSGTLYAFWNVVARFGVDIAARYNIETLGPANCTLMQGSRYVCAYLTEVIGYDSATRGYPVRTIGVDFGPAQPRFALTSEGTAFVAGAMPMIWDGVSCSDHVPLRKPKLYVNSAGGTGGVLTTGAYQFSAVVSWRDAQGKLHRSPPASPITISGAGMQPRVYVTGQPSYHDTINQTAYTVTIYASEVDGVTLYAQPYIYTSIGPWHQADNITQPVLRADTIPLYSDETSATALPSYCLGALLDVAVVSDRGWAISAEHKARAFYTKPAEHGVFFEFSPADMFVDLPASAGELVAVTSYRDALLLMSTSGIWTVAGDGPDALLQPPLFSAPQQVSDVPCTSTASVVSTPAGVLYKSNERYALFAGGQSTIFPQMLAGDVIGAAVFRDYQEAVFFLSNGTAHVYNYQANAWSLWSTDTLNAGSAVAVVAQETLDGPVLYFATSAGDLVRLDPDTVSTTAQVVIETGWVLLGSPQDDNTVQDIVIHDKYGGAHGLSISVATNYQVANSPRVVSLTDMLDLSMNDRCDIYVQPPQMAARAIKLVLTEQDAVGEGFQPANVTLELIKYGGKNIRSQIQTGRV